MRTRTVGELREGAYGVVRRVNLTEVYVASTSLQTHRIDGDPPYDVDTTLAVRGQLYDDRIDVHVSYTTSALSVDDDGSKSPVWTVEAEYVASFEMGEDASQVPISEDDLEAFAITMGPQTVHPYARELTQSLSARTPYPALTLGLITPVGAMPDDQALELPDRSVDG